MRSQFLALSFAIKQTYRVEVSVVDQTQASVTLPRLTLPARRLQESE
jgi:hypothetical protein